MSTQPDFSKLLDFPVADWVPEFRKFLAQDLKFLPDDWLRTIGIKGPDLKKLEFEGKQLLLDKALRPGRLASIKSQAESLQGMAAGILALMKANEPVELAHPMTSKLLNAANEDLMHVIFYFKSRFNAARPSAYLPDVAPMFAKPDPLFPGHPGYPSGHAAQSWMLASVYGTLFSKLRPALEQLAIDIAFNREVAGVHFQSDSEAGRELATKVFDLLMQNPKFSSMVEPARVEWPGNRDYI